MIKLITAMISVSMLACCTMTAKTPSSESSSNKIEISISPQDIVSQCTTPHEVYGFPPQPIPAIPVMIIRHGECLGHPNIVVAMWPGPKTKVNMLYVSMLVERYLEFLSANNEHYTANLIAVDSVIVDLEAEKESKESKESASTYAAVYKLVHVSSASQK